MLFDNNYELLHDRIDLKAVSAITAKEYQVGGSTALLDAIGMTIYKIGNAQKHSSDLSADGLGVSSGAAFPFRDEQLTYLSCWI